MYDFTPPSHEELKTRWELAAHLPQFVDERRLILAAIWWESQKRGKLILGKTYPLKTVQEMFEDKLREIGIEVKDA